MSVSQAKIDKMAEILRQLKNRKAKDIDTSIGKPTPKKKKSSYGRYYPYKKSRMLDHIEAQKKRESLDI